jgi:hypothetical protein
MSDISPNLQLPYILPDQAQKHVTHNEALQRLDGLCQIVLADLLSAPPGNPAPGTTYAVTAGATGVWFGHDGEIALFQDGEWLYARPVRGWLAWLEATQRTVVFDGSGWSDLKLPLRQDMFGVNASPDAYNRLSVSAPASLFNHAGGGHQLKINRAGDAETASLLFQSNFSGRAELGIAGDNSLSFKVSPDGATWTSALVIDPSGTPRMPNRPACRAALNPSSFTPAPDIQSGFQSFSVNQGRFALGAALPAGRGQKLVVPAPGLYLIVLNVLPLASSGHAVSLVRNDTTTLLAVRGNAASAGIANGMTTLATLDAGDTLALKHSGTAELDCGPGKTELMLTMV